MAGLVDDATVELADGVAAGLLAGSLIGSGLVALSFESNRRHTWILDLGGSVQ
jgi:hypothetical protein